MYGFNMDRLSESRKLPSTASWMPKVERKNKNEEYLMEYFHNLTKHKHLYLLAWVFPIFECLHFLLLDLHFNFMVPFFFFFFFFLLHLNCNVSRGAGKCQIKPVANLPRCLVKLPNPPKETGDCMPLASPNCREQTHACLL